MGDEVEIGASPMAYNEALRASVAHLTPDAQARFLSRVLLVIPEVPSNSEPEAHQPTTVGTVQDDDAIELSTSQQSAIDIAVAAIRARKPSFTFVTGKAGTGKSTVLRHIRKQARLIVCAPTGLAAVNVRGETVHRFFGLKKGPLPRSKVGANRNKLEIIERADAIVVDEISMVRVDCLDAISTCLQKTLGNKLPFGGKPVIAFGDMWQLEPVVTDDVSEWLSRNYPSQFWFDAKVFGQPGGGQTAFTMDGDEEPEATLPIQTVELLEVFRQIGNPEFIDALNASRVGDPSGLAYLNQRAMTSIPVGEAPISLTFTNKKADAINASRLNSLVGDSKVYTATITGEFDAKDIPVPQELHLKVGAQVMVAKNMVSFDGDFVCNGAVGEVVEFLSDGPLVALRDGRMVVVSPASWESVGYVFDAKKNEIEEDIKGEFIQIPLKLAWAITTHKSQGQTLDSAVLEMEIPAFAHGQLYVALSRVKRFDGLFLRRRLSPSDLITNQRVRDFCGIPAAAAKPHKQIKSGAFN